MIKKILKILTKNQKIKLLILILSSLPLIFLEAISISSLPIYLLTILDPSKIFEYVDNQYIENLIVNMSISDRSLYGLMVVIIIFFFKAVYNLLYNFFELSLIKKINLEHSSKIYTFYLNESYLFHTQNNPSKLIQNIDDVKRSTSVIFSTLNILKELILIFAILMILIFSDPIIILITAIIFSLPIIFFLTYFKNSLKIKGEIAKKSRILILKNLQESFSLIKFIKVIGNQNYIKKIFNLQNYRSLHQETIAGFISKTPRIILELFSVIAISLITIFLFQNEQKFEDILPLLTLLVISLVRFIPSVGIILVGINQYKFHHVSLVNIYNIFKLHENKMEDLNKKNTYHQIDKRLTKFCEEIEFDNVSFKYPGNNNYSLINLNFKIKKNTKIGLKGATGSGKSTLVALTMGLLNPDKGKIKIDGEVINKNIEGLQKIFGYVPQKVYLLDDTIKKNICFGVDIKDINEKKLEEVIKISGIDEFINNQPNQLDTIIGHAGTRLSGGQLQRIGIARALYLNPQILILDEPTSALDEKTEEQIIKKILSIKELTIILISHNSKVIEKCDKILNLRNNTINI